MTSPFDYVKSVTKTKEQLYTEPELFNKEYVPFIVNRALSNSPNFLPFAEVIDKYGGTMDKKLQYDFYFHGIPKSSRYEQLWTKKESHSLSEEHLSIIQSELGVSIKRAMQIYKLIGEKQMDDFIKTRGGKLNATRTKPT
jgi:Bacteriophage clamp loader A subunit